MTGRKTVSEPYSGQQVVEKSNLQRSEFRADLQGVRALAVLLVVLFHAQLSFLSGGFIGVDIFYVLSGYFITGILLREYVATEKISIRKFYERRIRRILPAASLVLCITAIGGYILMSPLALRHFALEVFSANFFSVNFIFAKDSVNYLAENINNSPILHYWSLAVEEQFYIFFPTFLIIIFALAKKLKRKKTFPVLVTAVVTMVSFGASIYLTSVTQPWAFFLLPSRAWELLIGALLAMYLQKHKGFSHGLSSILQILGLILIVWSTFTLNTHSTFPGSLAAIPVTGTAMLILATSSKSIAYPLLAHPISQALGRWSFSIYLWHWPLLIFVWMYFDQKSAVPNSCMVLLSVGLAALTYRFWENPIRLNQYWPKSKHRIRNITVLALGIPLLLVSMLYHNGVNGSSANSVVAPVSQEQLHRAIMNGLQLDQVPSTLSPSWANANNDKPKPYSNGCHVIGYDNITLKPCVFANPTSKNSIWLVGDSHAEQWFTGVEAIAKGKGFRFVATTKSACPTLLSAVSDPVNKNKSFDACIAYNRKVLHRASVERPKYVVVSARYFLVTGAGGNGLAEYLRQMSKYSKVIFLEDTPNPPANIPFCISTKFKKLSDCAFSISGAQMTGQEAIKQQVSQSGVSYIPVSNWFCIQDRCPAVADNVLIYRDDSHISTSAAYWLSKVLDASTQVGTK